MIYAFRAGYSLSNVTAQVVGETLAALEKKHGKVTPDGVISESRRAGHPMNHLFEWNNDKAADQWRVEQARGIIRSVEVVTVLENGEQTRELGYVSVAESKAGGSAYINTKSAMADEKFSIKVIQDAEAQLAGWRRRYGGLIEIRSRFSKVIDAIDKALQQTATEEKPDGESEKRTPATNKRRRRTHEEPAIAASAR